VIHGTDHVEHGQVYRHQNATNGRRQADRHDGLNGAREQVGVPLHFSAEVHSDLLRRRGQRSGLFADNDELSDDGREDVRPFE
jgi:hypothetical protein